MTVRGSLAGQLAVKTAAKAVIMFSTGPSYDKLKTNLRLCMSRLKLAQKKKAELGQKSRREIADYLSMGKPDRARIRVEHIIREDYYCEAMEMIEMYCDLILARFGLIRETQTIDTGLEESVSSIIWAGPRIVTDIPEIKMVCDQLGKKYGELYVKGIREQTIDTVNAKLMHRLSAEPPPRNLVESYLKEIAAAHNLEYEPQFIDDPKGPGDGGIGELIDMGGSEPSAAVGFRPDLMDPSSAPKPARIAPGFEPPMPEVNFPGPSVPPALPKSPPVAQKPPKQDTPMDPFVGGNDPPPPSYDHATMGRHFPPDVPNLDLSELPDLPDVPHSDAATPRESNGQQNSVDFDELSRRFEELKKRK